MTEPSEPMSEPMTDARLAEIRELADRISAGHPDFGSRDDLAAWQKEMASIWALNLQSCLSGYVPALLAEVDYQRAENDRLRAEVTALTELIDGVKDGAKELIEALPTSRLEGMTASEIDAYEDCAETWYHMIREVLDDV